MARPQFLQLPNELLVRIFKCLQIPVGHPQVDDARIFSDARQMRQICQVCRQFHRVAKSFVYQTFQLACGAPPPGHTGSMSWDTGGTTDPRPLKQLLHLRSVPEAAGHIRAFVCPDAHCDVGEMLSAFREPAVRALLHSRYLPEFSTFLFELIAEASGETESHDFNDYDDDWKYFLAYQLAVIFVLTLAYNVEAVTISVEAVAIGLEFGIEDSLLGRFFDFCGEQHSTARALSSTSSSISSDGQGQPRLPAPLSRLRTLDITHEQNRAQLSSHKVEPLLQFPGLTECRTSGLTWSARPAHMLAKTRTRQEPTVRHFEIKCAIFPSSRRECDHAIRDAVLETSGPSLETLILHVDHNVPDDDDEHVISELFPREAIDFTPLGHALRTHGTTLRRFELDLYADAVDYIDFGDRGTLGDLRHAISKLVYLKAPVSRLGGSQGSGDDHDSDDSQGEDEEEPSSRDQATAAANIPVNNLGDILPESLRYLWTDLPRSIDTSNPYGTALQNLLENPAATLPNLEWLLVFARRHPDLEPPLLSTITGDAAYWEQSMMGRFHILYRRRPDPPRHANTLREGKHPSEWTEAVEDEIRQAAVDHRYWSRS